MSQREGPQSRAGSHRWPLATDFPALTQTAILDFVYAPHWTLSSWRQLIFWCQHHHAVAHPPRLPFIMADTEEGSDGEAPTVLAAHMTIDFPHVALQVEDDILESAARPEPDWEVHRMSKLLKQQLRLKRQGRVRSPSVDQGRAADSPSPRSRGSQMEHQRASADIPEKDFDDWNRRPNLRIGPDITRTSSPAFHVLPDGRLYCNLQFALLKAKDKVTYTWVDPNGCRYCRKTTTKMLGQRRTWSWNYIDLSEDRARRLPGGWQIRVAVNGHQVLQAAFNVLADWISVEKGSLPIILLCPQSGRIVPADCRQRTPDQGDDRACADTFEIARNVKSHLIYMFGVAPTVISCRLHRRWLDVNLSEPNAFTDAKMAPYYHAYYAAVLSAIQHAWKVQRRSPLIISLSAHHAFSETIYISTLNGKTVAGMRERGEGGDPRFTNEGLNARLSASRFTVSMISASEPSANRKPHVACTSLQSQSETHPRSNPFV